MNFEEKVLSTLDLLVSEVGEVKTRLTGVETEVAEVKIRLAKVETEVTELKDRVEDLDESVTELKDRVEDLSETVAVIEVEHGQKLGALFDGYKLVSEGLQRLPEFGETIEKVSMIENVVTEHSKTVNVMKAVVETVVKTAV
ncbi:MAG: hypothetical protein FWC89_04945 [Defluviitaleaceae bacterium]|nr:hypothetical protein [Defluviitaleaceae bacterium]